MNCNCNDVSIYIYIYIYISTYYLCCGLIDLVFVAEEIEELSATAYEVEHESSSISSATKTRSMRPQHK